MATGTQTAFNHTAKLVGQKLIDFASDTWKIMALATPPAGTETVATALSAAANLASATLTLATTAISWTTTNTDDAKFDGPDLTFTASGGSSTIKAYAVINASITSPASPPISWGYPDTAKTSTGVVLADTETWKLQWNASGIMRLVANA